MPRHQLTTAERQSAAASTNLITRDRKAKRQASVRHLHSSGKTTAEIAQLLDVSTRTIKRDLEALKQKGEIDG